MIVLEGYKARIRVVTQGYAVRVRRNGVNIYVPMRASAASNYTTLSGTSATFPAGSRIEAVTIDPHAAERTVQIGTTLGGSDYANETIAANTALDYTRSLYATAPTTLYFSVSGGPLGVVKIYRSLP